MPEFVLPDNFETYPEARKKAFLTMKELKEQGRRIVGVFCTYTPWELINAADAVAVVLCGIGDDNIPASQKPMSADQGKLWRSRYGSLSILLFFRYGPCGDDL